MYFCVFAEGGRLEQELKYTEEKLGASSELVNQIVIQTPVSGNNVLTQESFIQHRDAIVRASDIVVNMFELLVLLI